ncbi:MAG: Hpt domain-containing protein [Solirubrobacterales bacterium]
MTDPLLVDLDALAVLRTEIGPGPVQELLEFFVSDARRLVRDFATHTEAGQGKAAAKAVHNLKSSSALLGLPALFAAARAAEARPFEQDPRSAGELRRVLDETIGRLSDLKLIAAP